MAEIFCAGWSDLFYASLFVQYLIAFRSRPEVSSDVISSANVRQHGVNAPVKFGDFSSNASRDIQERSPSDWAFSHFDNCQPEEVSDVISGMVNQDIGMDVCANFGDSSLKPSKASFSALFRTSMTSDRMYIVTSYPAWL